MAKKREYVPSLSWILALTAATVSPLSTSRTRVLFPVGVFTKTCILLETSISLVWFDCPAW
jgi:hypothetical protein